MLAADRKRYRPRGKIKQITIKRGVRQWQLKGGRVMQVDISSGYCRIRIAPEEADERIEGCGRIRIQQGISQTRLADFAYGQVLPLVASVTEAQFPVPRLEVIAKFSHLTLKSDVEEHIPVGKLLVSGPGVVNATKPDAGGHRDWGSVNNQSRISHCERIKCILDWHADAGRAKAYGSSRSFKRIRRKRNSRQRCIEKRSRNFEIGKYGQVFVAQIAGERAVERLPVGRWKRWRESREVKEQVVPIARGTIYNAGYRKWIGIKWRRRDVRSRMRCRSVRAEKQTGNQTLAMHSARFVPTANIESSKWNKIAVTGNVAVTAEQATRALVEIGDHHDVGLVIARAGFQPRFPFTHIVGTAEVCIAVRATDFQATELVDQEEIDHTSDGICSVHRRSAILQDIDVIDHGEGNQLDVVATEYCSLCDALAVYQNQGLFWQNAAQVQLDGTVAAIGDVLVNGAARLLRDKRGQVGCVTDTQLLDVLRAIGVHRVRAGLFRRGNIRTGHHDTLDLSRRRRRRRVSRNGRCRQLSRCA